MMAHTIANKQTWTVSMLSDWREAQGLAPPRSMPRQMVLPKVKPPTTKAAQVSNRWGATLPQKRATMAAQLTALPRMTNGNNRSTDWICRARK